MNSHVEKTNHDKLYQIYILVVTSARKYLPLYCSLLINDLYNDYSSVIYKISIFINNKFILDENLLNKKKNLSFSFVNKQYFSNTWIDNIIYFFLLHPSLTFIDSQVTFIFSDGLYNIYQFNMHSFPNSIKFYILHSRCSST